MAKPSSPTKTPPTRTGTIAVMGAPNAGKSTLVNALVGGKVSIVSPKVQTTRFLVRGITVHNNAQLVFIDTPGLFTPQKRLERAMVGAARQGEAEADIILLIIDSAAKLPEEILKNLVDDGRPYLLVLNKIDKIPREKLLALAQDLNTRFPFTATFMISALKADGTKALLDDLAARLPEGPFLYPEDEMSDLPMRLLAAEITREKLFLRLHKELPYGLSVETESWEDFNNGSVKMSQVIFIARESHKPIVLGKRGSLLKTIGTDSRKELEDILGTRVHLNLLVKVDERWLEDPERYKAMGLEFGNI